MLSRERNTVAVASCTYSMSVYHNKLHTILLHTFTLLVTKYKIHPIE